MYSSPQEALSPANPAVSSAQPGLETGRQVRVRRLRPGYDQYDDSFRRSCDSPCAAPFPATSAYEPGNPRCTRYRRKKFGSQARAVCRRAGSELDHLHQNRVSAKLPAPMTTHTGKRPVQETAKNEGRDLSEHASFAPIRPARPGAELEFIELFPSKCETVVGLRLGS